ncbi:hypothetical protein [Aquibacillus rhizosphaerae]|uniref:Uncharacterized protein n=1 Tax=Aquibacillus rhizosphaerae TaxID=3051431 RepID=A0ABT7LBR7_9BACI|nr:hypothetical protein [Aquibacillus sp. LR5S19]MDL4842645.1 hypothetical protein [Aquibacillus sp. LR5S19]
MRKYRDIDEIKLSYLRFQTPQELRGNVIVCFLILLDLMGVLPLLAEPFSWQFIWPIIIPVGLIHVGAIIYLVAPYRFEESYYLLIGIYGLVNSFVYFLAIQKFIYMFLGAENAIYFILGLIFFVGLLVLSQVINIKMLYSSTYRKLQKNEAKINVSPILTATGFGYIIAQVIMSTLVTTSIKWIVIILVLSIMSIITAFFSTNIHRYFYIRKNRNTVSKLYPEFGLPKKLRKSQFSI